ncbi:9348_t:CDS:10 [Funneliformis mosseae]|uniref:9348_t:CDS:1 n=1 Tax=Funneliformis mosseae TaxID=27381 RepID=A0A9N9E224_FUNMO|nr:9348_t:CDS:10 [Funneliformis mosseae]
MSSIIDGVGFDYFVKTPVCDWSPLDYHVFWKNDGLVLDKSILTRFIEQVEWFIENGAVDEQEKAKYLKMRFQDESATSEQSHYYALRKKQKAEVDIFNTPKIEVLASINTKSHLENYNIVCLFDIEFPYTKQLFMKLSTDQIRMMKSKWTEAEAYISKEEIEKCWNECPLKKLVDDNHQIIKENSDEDTLYVDLNGLMTSFTKQKTLQLLHKHSALLDNESSEFKYRDDIVNPLLASIFYDVEDALWMKTLVFELKAQEDERGKLGDKHDGILYMNINGVKISVGYFEVVAMMVSLYYQRVHQSDDVNTHNCNFGREYHLLSMHLVDEMYIVDEYDAFVVPDSGVDLLQIGKVIEIVKKFKVRMIKYYRQLIKKPRKVTRLPSSGLPVASPSKKTKKK